MDIKELDSFRLSDAISFHENLNPKLWRGNKLIPVVKDQLLTIAKDFLEELGIHELDVRDITISGSNAAYTYTPHSDLDLHILVNMNDLPQSDVYKELFNAKKTIYNDTHDISVHGVPVELYVQDSNQPVKSLGEYSIKNDKWLKIPTKRRANFDQTATKAKYDKLLELVKTALKTKDSGKLSKILSKIKQYRQAGLDKKGEFGPENLAYKALRSQGYITKLYDLRDKLHSEKLSIEGMYSVKPKSDKLTDDLRKEFEDYDPNGPPPGPEFKPTMPKGTVRVDVSDVYDWYKLGQHISNMKGLGQHDFGQGPPSTILSFGDEDTEHKYIQDLEKTGLSTTDIDPKAHDVKKGQKIDPTYNVNEKINPNITKPGFIKEKVINTKKGDIKLVANTPKDNTEVFPQFYIRGYNESGKQIAYLRLNIRDFEKFSVFPWNRKDPKNAFLVAGNVSVFDEYKRLGIATEMYKFAKELGNDIKPSSTQTDDGKAMWRGFEKNKQDVSEGLNTTEQKLLDMGRNKKYIYINGRHQHEAAKKLVAKGLAEKYDDASYYASGGDYYVNPFTRKQGLTKRGLKVYGGTLYFKDNSVVESASGYIPSEVEKVDPTFNVNESKFNKCFDKACQLYDKAVQKGLEPILYQVADYRGDGSNADSRWTKLPQHVWSHYVTVIGDTVFDPTAKQFGDEKQEKYSIDKLKSEWNKIYKIRPREMNESASGYIPSNAEKDDPRYKTALTVDIKPDTMKKDAKKFGNKISRAGIPPTLKASGKF